MKLKTFKFPVVAALFASGFLASCVADENSPGLEYMPDMYRSPAVEAYVDYAEVEGVKDEEAQKLVEEKFSFKPPVGTIKTTPDGQMYLPPYNHAAPLNIDKTHGLFEVATDSAGRDAAKNDVNPVLYTEEVKKDGKVLFERFCIHCHGAEGDGQGTVITGSNGKYPTPGPYKKELTAGEIFYTITYGKNAMGSHASQVNPYERWMIVHYVESLIGKEKVVAEPLLYDAHTDTDGDGVMDNVDECPEVKGTNENHGCPAMTEDAGMAVEAVSTSLVFDSGSSIISSGSNEELNKFAQYLEAHPEMNLIINGHTDNSGSEMANRALSLDRANHVKDYLVAQGVAKDRIQAIGYGQNKPIASNDTEEGRLENRRVEFRLF